METRIFGCVFRSALKDILAKILPEFVWMTALLMIPSLKIKIICAWPAAQMSQLGILVIGSPILVWNL